MQVWAEPFTTLRLQKTFNLYMDPFERADITSNTYWDWQLRHVQMMYGVMADVMVFADSFKEFPPRAYPPSFNPANIMEDVKRGLKAKAALEKHFPMLQQQLEEARRSREGSPN
jgi:arylsulfatase